MLAQEDGHKNIANGDEMSGAMDECCFNEQPDNRWTFIQKECDTKNNPAFVHESVQFDRDRVMIWAGLSYQK